MKMNPWQASALGAVLCFACSSGADGSDPADSPDAATTLDADSAPEPDAGQAPAPDAAPDAGPLPEPDAGPTTPQIDWLAAGEPPVAAPQIPWLEVGTPDRPRFTCPERWRSVTGNDGVSTCDPWPETGRATCAEPWEAHFPGEPGCRMVGAPCPDGPWPADLPASGVWYVQPGAMAGDGSVAAPFGSIAEALDAAAAGDTIALSEGVHAGPIAVSAAVTLRGACAARTSIVRGPIEGDRVPIVSVSANATLRDLTVTGGVGSGVKAFDGVTLEARGVAAYDLDDAGFDLDQGRGALVADELVVSDVDRIDNLDGVGVALSGPNNHVRRVEVRDVDGLGISVLSASALKLGDVSIHDIRRGMFGFSGGIQVGGGSTATIERAVCEAVADDAFEARENAQVLLRDCVARDLRTPPEQACGLLVWGEETAVTAERLWIERPVKCGVAVAGATADLTDVVVRDLGGDADLGDVGIASLGAELRIVRGQVSGVHDRALRAEGDGTVVAEHLVLEDIRGQALSLAAGTSTFSDVAIRRAPPGAPDTNGFGIRAGEGAHLQVDRLLIEGLAGLGLSFTGKDGPVDGALRDVVVRDIVPGADGKYGDGVRVANGAGPLAIERFLVRNVYEVGIAVWPGSDLALTDLRVEHVESESSSGQFGEGLWASGAQVAVERAAIADTRQAAVDVVASDDFETHVSLTDVAVNGVRAQHCVEQGTCPEATAATGVYLQGVEVPLSRVAVRQATVALQSFGGTFTGADVVAADCSVGLNLQEGATAEIERLDTQACETPTSDEALAVPVQ